MQKNTSKKAKNKKALKRKKKILFSLVSIVFIFIVIFLAYYYGVSKGKPVEFESAVVADTSLFPPISKSDVSPQISVINKKYRNNWFDYISVDRKFSFYGIGGIEDLKIIAINETDYLIDEVTVKICYVVDNGSCYKNEVVTVYNIPPNSSRSVDAPSSSRGKEVGLEIIGVYSDKMNFLYTPSILTKGVDDPYFNK